MNRKLIKTLSLIIATASLMSLAGCTINIDKDLIDSIKGETTEASETNRRNDDRDDSENGAETNDQDSKNDDTNSNENVENTENNQPAYEDTSYDADDHDPNQPLEGIGTLEDQIACLVSNRSTWEITNSSDMDYYAVTDFDHDGHYEILCVTTGGSGRYTYSSLYEVNNECTGVNLIANFEAGVSDEVSGLLMEIDWFNEDYNYVRLPGGAYSYEVFDMWSAGALDFGEAKIELTFDQSGVSTTRMGSCVTSGDDVTFTDANGNIISQNEYDTAFDSTMLSGTTFGSVHISYTRNYYSSDPFSSVSDSELTNVLMDSANGFEFFVG